MKRVACGLLLGWLLAGCGSMQEDTKLKHSARVMSYLYPDQAEQADRQPPLLTSLTTLKVPLRIGVAFVPSAVDPKTGLPESEQLRLLGRVRDSFAQYPFVAGIEIIPTSYLREGGGYEDMTRVATLFRLDVMTLLSYDQVQFSDATGSSFWYWTLVGAYLVAGDKYDIYTTLEASAFDVASRKLLFRAPGTSTIAGSAEAVGFAEKARLARIDGFNQALEQLIPTMHAELQRFRQRARQDQSIRLDLPPGYPGGTE